MADPSRQPGHQGLPGVVIGDLHFNVARFDVVLELGPFLGVEGKASAPLICETKITMSADREAGLILQNNKSCRQGAADA